MATPLAPGTTVLTPHGPGVILESTILHRYVIVRHTNGATWAYEPADLIAHTARARKP